MDENNGQLSSEAAKNKQPFLTVDSRISSEICGKDSGQYKNVEVYHEKKADDLHAEDNSSELEGTTDGDKRCDMLVSEVTHEKKPQNLKNVEETVPTKMEEKSSQLGKVLNERDNSSVVKFGNGLTVDKHVEKRDELLLSPSKKEFLSCGKTMVGSGKCYKYSEQSKSEISKGNEDSSLNKFRNKCDFHLEETSNVTNEKKEVPFPYKADDNTDKYREGSVDVTDEGEELPSLEIADRTDKHPESSFEVENEGDLDFTGSGNGIKGKQVLSPDEVDVTSDKHPKEPVIVTSEAEEALLATKAHGSDEHPKGSENVVNEEKQLLSLHKVDVTNSKGPKEPTTVSNKAEEIPLATKVLGNIDEHPKGSEDVANEEKQVLSPGEVDNQNSKHPEEPMTMTNEMPLPLKADSIDERPAIPMDMIDKEMQVSSPSKADDNQQSKKDVIDSNATLSVCLQKCKRDNTLETERSSHFSTVHDHRLKVQTALDCEDFDSIGTSIQFSKPRSLISEDNLKQQDLEEHFQVLDGHFGTDTVNSTSEKLQFVKNVRMEGDSKLFPEQAERHKYLKNTDDPIINQVDSGNNSNPVADSCENRPDFEALESANNTSESCMKYIGHTAVSASYSSDLVKGKDESGAFAVGTNASKQIQFCLKYENDEFTCNPCSFTGAVDKVQEHIMQHLLVRPYKCLYCSTCFVRRSEIAEHVDRNHPGKTMKCALRAIKRANAVMVKAKKDGSYMYVPPDVTDTSLSGKRKPRFNSSDCEEKAAKKPRKKVDFTNPVRTCSQHSITEHGDLSSCNMSGSEKSTEPVEVSVNSVSKSCQNKNSEESFPLGHAFLEEKLSAAGECVSSLTEAVLVKPVLETDSPEHDSMQLKEHLKDSLLSSEQNMTISKRCTSDDETSLTSVTSNAVLMQDLPDVNSKVVEEKMLLFQGVEVGNQDLVTDSGEHLSVSPLIDSGDKPLVLQNCEEQNILSRDKFNSKDSQLDMGQTVQKDHKQIDTNQDVQKDHKQVDTNQNISDTNQDDETSSGCQPSETFDTSFPKMTVGNSESECDGVTDLPKQNIVGTSECSQLPMYLKGDKLQKVNEESIKQESEMELDQTVPVLHPRDAGDSIVLGQEQDDTDESKGCLNISDLQSALTKKDKDGETEDRKYAAAIVPEQEIHVGGFKDFNELQLHIDQNQTVMCPVGSNDTEHESESWSEPRHDLIAGNTTVEGDCALVMDLTNQITSVNNSDDSKEDLCQKRLKENPSLHSEDKKQDVISPSLEVGQASENPVLIIDSPESEIADGNKESAKNHVFHTDLKVIKDETKDYNHSDTFKALDGVQEKSKNDLLKEILSERIPDGLVTSNSPHDLKQISKDGNSNKNNEKSLVLNTSVKVDDFTCRKADTDGLCSQDEQHDVGDKMKDEGTATLLDSHSTGSKIRVVSDTHVEPDKGWSVLPVQTPCSEKTQIAHVQKPSNKNVSVPLQTVQTFNTPSCQPVTCSENMSSQNILVPLSVGTTITLSPQAVPVGLQHIPVVPMFPVLNHPTIVIPNNKGLGFLSPANNIMFVSQPGLDSNTNKSSSTRQPQNIAPKVGRRQTVSQMLRTNLVQPSTSVQGISLLNISRLPVENTNGNSTMSTISSEDSHKEITSEAHPVTNKVSDTQSQGAPDLHISDKAVDHVDKMNVLIQSNQPLQNKTNIVKFSPNLLQPQKEQKLEQQISAGLKLPSKCTGCIYIAVINGEFVCCKCRSKYKHRSAFWFHVWKHFHEDGHLCQQCVIQPGKSVVSHCSITDKVFDALNLPEQTGKTRKHVGFIISEKNSSSELTFEKVDGSKKEDFIDLTEDVMADNLISSDSVSSCKEFHDKRDTECIQEKNAQVNCEKVSGEDKLDLTIVDCKTLNAEQYENMTVDGKIMEKVCTDIQQLPENWCQKGDKIKKHDSPLKICSVPVYEEISGDENENEDSASPKTCPVPTYKEIYDNENCDSVCFDSQEVISEGARQKQSSSTCVLEQQQVETPYEKEKSTKILEIAEGPLPFIQTSPAKSGIRNSNRIRRQGFFVCTGCDYSCLETTPFRKHLIDCHPSSSPNCYHCGFRAESIDILMRHFLKHSLAHAPGYAVFSCAVEQCKFRSNILEGYCKHLVTWHQDLNLYVCKECRDEFWCLEDLITHIKDNILHVVTCRHCSARHSDRNVIKEHIEKVHPEKGKMMYVVKQLLCRNRLENNYNQGVQRLKDTFGGGDASSSEPVLDGGGLQKEICAVNEMKVDAAVSNGNLLVTLLADKKDAESFCCHMCTFVTDGRKSLDNHLLCHTEKDHKEENFACPSCPKQFRDIVAFEIHAACHSDKIHFVVFKCNLCDYQTNNRNLILRHEASEHSDRRGEVSTFCEHERKAFCIVLKCTDCSFRTLSVSVLEEHLKKHTFERPVVKATAQTIATDTTQQSALKSESSSKGCTNRGQAGLCGKSSSNDAGIMGTDHEEEKTNGEELPTPNKQESPPKNIVEFPVPKGNVFWQQVKCPKCDFSSYFRTNIIRHIHMKHSDVVVTDSMVDSVDKDGEGNMKSIPSSPAADSRWHAPAGFSVGSQQLDLKLRPLYDKHWKTFECKTCPTVFIALKPLHWHLFDHLGMTWRCHYCDFTSKNPDNVRSHIAEEHKHKEDWVVPVDDLETAVENLAEQIRCSGLAKQAKCILGSNELEEKLQSMYQYNKKEIHCKICKILLPSKYLAHVHIVQHHLKRHFLECGYCSLGGLERYKLVNHMKEKHVGKSVKIIKVDVDIAKDVDNFWALNGGENSSLVGHLSDTQPLEVKKKMAPLGSDDLDLKLNKLYDTDQKSSKYVCAYCQREHHSKYSVHRHILQHLEIFLVQCHYCEFKEIELSQVSDHIKQSHPHQPVRVRHLDVDIEKSLGNITAKKIQQSPTQKQLCDNSESNGKITHIKGKQNLPTVASKFPQINLSPSKMAKEKDKDEAWSKKNIVAVKDGRLKKYKCRFCGYLALTRNSVGTHVFKAHKNTASKKILSPQKIKEKMHSEEDETNKRYGCSLCSFKSHLMEMLKKHMATKHPWDKDDFKVSTSTHDLSDDKTEILKTKKRKRISFMKKDVAVAESKPEKEAEIPEKKRKEEMDVEGKKLYKCLKCEYISEQSGDNLEKHLLQNHGIESLLQCAYCSAKYTSLDALKRHVGFFHKGREVEYSSPVPFDSFEVVDESSVKETENSLSNPADVDVFTSYRRRSTEIHTVCWAYLCIYCDFREMDSTKMRYHIAEHISYRPYSCGLCKKDFTNPNERATHAKKSHPGIDTYCKIVRVQDREDKLKQLVLDCKNHASRKLVSVLVKGDSFIDKKCKTKEDISVSKDAESLNEDISSNLRTEEEKNNFLCYYCEHSGQSAWAVKVHYGLKHGKSSKRHWLWVDKQTGHVCDASSIVSDKEKTKDDVSHAVGFLCGYCNFRSSKRGNVTCHQVIHKKPPWIINLNKVRHLASEESSSEDDDSETGKEEIVPFVVSPRSSRTRYCCSMCSYRIESLYQYRLHLATHGNFKYLASDMSQDSALRCGYCMYIASDKADFSQHLSTHIDNRTFKCGYCSYDAYHRKDIRSHLAKSHRSKTEKVIDLKSLIMTKKKHQKSKQKLVDLDPYISVGDILSLSPDSFENLLNSNGVTTIDLQCVPNDKMLEVLRVFGADIPDEDFLAMMETDSD